jgi:hypothetical protein
MMHQKAGLQAATACAALLLSPGLAWAQDDNPFQIAFVGPTMQLVDDDEDVSGIRLNLLYGVNQNMSGVDLGLINHTRGDMVGVGFGLVNVTDGTFVGWQAGVINLTQRDFTGLQWSAWSALSLANIAGEGRGAQIAWVFNQAEYLGGFQLALVNIANDMNGVQVGLINIIRSKERFPVLPLVNWKLEGREP